MRKKVRAVVEGSYHMQLSVIPYFTGIGDGSYMTCTAPAQERALLTNLMSLPASIYDIPFESRRPAQRTRFLPRAALPGDPPVVRARLPA